MRDDIAHALAYPFAPPASSFYLTSETAEPRRLRLRSFAGFARQEDTAPLCRLEVTLDGRGNRTFEDRVPVIAAGSNASPARLHSKFVEAGIIADFPVIRAAVPDLVPVYSAHISKYGSIPGTLTGEAGTRSFLAIAFLTKTELQVLNASEAIGKNYALGLINGLDIRLAPGARLDRVLAYVSKRGAFSPRGSAIRISAFHTRGSALPSAGQRRILQQAKKITGSQGTLAAFIRRQNDDDDERLHCTAVLARHARACAIAGLHVIAGGMQGPSGRLPDW